MGGPGIIATSPSAARWPRNGCVAVWSIGNPRRAPTRTGIISRGCSTKFSRSAAAKENGTSGKPSISSRIFSSTSTPCASPRRPGEKKSPARPRSPPRLGGLARKPPRLRRAGQKKRPRPQHLPAALSPGNRLTRPSLRHPARYRARLPAPHRYRPDPRAHRGQARLHRRLLFRALFQENRRDPARPLSPHTPDLKAPRLGRTLDDIAPRTLDHAPLDDHRHHPKHVQPDGIISHGWAQRKNRFVSRARRAISLLACAAWATPPRAKSCASARPPMAAFTRGRSRRRTASQERGRHN